MYLFIISIDDIIRDIAKDFPVVAYADDLIIGIKKSDNLDEIMDLLVEKYKSHGLLINKTKCHCTRHEKTKFLGVEFSPDKNITLTIS